jgi:BA14K-like protein
MRLGLSMLSAALLGIGASTANVSPSSAQANPAQAVAQRVQDGTIATDYSQYRRYGGRRYYGRPYAGRYYRRGGGAAAAGIIGGLAAGAIIGGAVASQQAQAAPVYAAPGNDAVAYCMQRFRSYDPASGTYLGYDGMRHPCP